MTALSTGSSELVCEACGHLLRGEARFCDACGHRVRTPSPEAVPQEMRTVTVLFADLKGFTAMAERVDPEDVHAVVRRVFALTDRAIGDLGGVVDKHMGDGLMALFGTPVAHEDDAARAIRAALRFQAEVVALSQTLSEEGLPPVRLRVGINTGRVVVGALQGQGDTTVYGDAVNVASRLEAACPPGDVLVSHETYRRVRGLFEVDALPPLHVKGKAQRVHGYLVRAEKPAHLYIGTSEVLGRESAMIGRDTELAILMSAVQWDDGHRRACLLGVVAPPGHGKTRLVHAFLARVESMEALAFLLRARATTETTREPYHLLGRLLKSSAGVAEGDGAEGARQKLVETFARMARRAEDAGVGDPELDPAVAAQLVGELIGLPFPDTERKDVVDPLRLRDRAVESLAALFRCRTRLAPLVLELEDLHWADEASVALIEDLLRALADQPFAVVYSARPEVAQRFAGLGRDVARHQTIVLEPLDRRIMRDLVEHLLAGVSGVTSALVERVSEGAGGVPYFAVEIVKNLADTGVLVDEGEGWALDAARAQRIPIPASVEGVLQARLDRLDPAAAAAARVAAVVGRVFWDTAVFALWTTAGARRQLPAAPDRGALAEALKILVDRELAQVRPLSVIEGATEYVFVHDLTRAVAYRGLVKTTRRRLHAMMADWLIERTGERVREWEATIAGHLDRGGRATSAGRWYVRAGEAAAAVYGNADALQLLDRALALGSLPDVETIGARLRKAEVLQLVGRWPEALAELDVALPQVQRLGDRIQLAHCHSRRAALYTLVGQFDRAVPESDLAVRLARDTGAPEVLAQALGDQGHLQRRRGALRRAISARSEALELYRGLGDERGIAEELLALATLHLGRARDARALAHLEEARRLLEVLGDPRLLADCLHSVAYLRHHRGESDQALSSYQRSLTLRSAVGDRPHQAWNLHNMSEIHRDRGAIDEAERLAAEALAISRTVGNRPGEGYGRTNQGHLAAWRGDLDGALLHIQASLEIFREVGEEPQQAVQLDRLADVRRGLGHLAAALRASDEASQLHARVGNRQSVVDTLVVRACVLRDLGGLDEAREALDEAERQTRSERVPPRVRVRVEQALLADRSGQGVEALSLAYDAVGTRRRGEDCCVGEGVVAELLVAKHEGGGDPAALAERASREASARHDGAARLLAVECLLARGEGAGLRRVLELPERPVDCAERHRLLWRYQEAWNALGEREAASRCRVRARSELVRLQSSLPLRYRSTFMEHPWVRSQRA